MIMINDLEIITQEVKLKPKMADPALAVYSYPRILKSRCCSQ